MIIKFPDSKLPKTWSELLALKNKIPKFRNNITRFTKDNQYYNNHQKSIPRQQYIQRIIDEIGNKNYKITPNKFPYSRLIQHLPNVKHYCLWSNIKEPSSDIIESEIKKKFPNLNYFWFVNPPNNKSIPEIWHCHIFVNEN